MTDREVSEIQLRLKTDRNLRDVVKGDDAALAQTELKLEDLVSKVDQLIAVLFKTTEPYCGQIHVVRLGNTVQYRNDQSAMILEMIGKNSPGWTGIDPFSDVPSHPDWHLVRRRQSPVLVGDSLYIVASITWGGAHEVCVCAWIMCRLHPQGPSQSTNCLVLQCPFKQADEQDYHGYQYGYMDHVIMAPPSRGQQLKIHISDLSLHMARNHGFCGVDPAYRINPVHLANVLGCGPMSEAHHGMGSSVKPQLLTVEVPPVMEKWSEGPARASSAESPE